LLRNDLWYFNTNQQYWYWISGSSLLNANASTAPIGVESQFISPGSMQDSFCYCDSTNSLRLFGPTSDWRMRFSSSKAYWALLSQGSVTTIYGQPNVKAVGSKMSQRWGIALIVNSNQNPAMTVSIAGNTSLGVTNEVWLNDPCSQVTHYVFHRYYLTTSIRQFSLTYV
jgi:hypothetical protein